jgi:AraC-like DNA-binding protein
VYRIIEKNLSGDKLEEFYISYKQGVEQDELLDAGTLFSKIFIDERYWLNILLLALRDDMIGARMAVLMAPYHKTETAGPVAAMMLTAPNIRSFIEPMVRYQPALDPTLIMGREEIPGGLRLIAHYDGIEGEVGQCFIYSGIYMLEDAMQRMSLWDGEPTPIMTVKAPQPTYFQDVRNLFYSKVFWEPDEKKPGLGWSIDIPDELLDVPNYLANGKVHQDSCRALEYIIKSRASWVADAVEKGDVGGTQTELVRSTLMTALTLLSQAQMSERVKCEPRTLQKRLQKEGSSWSELITEEFMRRAEPSLLRDMGSKQLAEELGMTESNFYRKFQKLYGATPKEWLVSQQERSYEQKIESTNEAVRKMRR